ncbi:hypothetical protein [Phocaeicola sp.]
MKQTILLLLGCACLSSCSTLFTQTRQPVTFIGENGTKIFDASTNVKLGEIKKDNTITLQIKKKLGDKYLLAKKEGYAPTPLLVESSFNPVSLWNLLFWPGFIIDLGTGKINKYDAVSYEIEMEKVAE